MSETLTRPTLPTFSWIGHLKQDDRELLSSYGEFFPGHPGNVIIHEGAMQTQVFVVITGKLEVRARQDDDSEVLLAQVGPGETLGEISLFCPGPAAATVTAVEFSQLWRIADADLMHFMEENPGAGNVLLRTLASILAQRLRQMNPRAFGLSTYAVVDSPELQEQAPSEILEETETTPSRDQPKAPPVTPPMGLSEAYKVKRVSTKTQIVPELDDIEPL
jgi:CRP/FNR family cyclic AMP-dependent transcriptional regulator